ncbi:MAG: hypothetical protein JWL59_4831 [Chthoniobacteraceae bacterium]|nr:hypothetical protein [Chthoniobacteraceae bacterium]
MSLKHASRDSNATQSAGNACWRRERNRAALCVELPSGEFFLLPYQQFAVAHLSRTDVGEALLISFFSHDVMLNGDNLAELALALQDLAVAWVTPAPARYQSSRGSDGASITAIQVTPAGEGGR